MASLHSLWRHLPWYVHLKPICKEHYLSACLIPHTDHIIFSFCHVLYGLQFSRPVCHCCHCCVCMTCVFVTSVSGSQAVHSYYLLSTSSCLPSNRHLEMLIAWWNCFGVDSVNILCWTTLLSSLIWAFLSDWFSSQAWQSLWYLRIKYSNNHNDHWSIRLCDGFFQSQ